MAGEEREMSDHPERSQTAEGLARTAFGCWVEL